MNRIKIEIIEEITKNRDKSVAELQQLLGIQPVPVIPPLAQGGVIIGDAGQGRPTQSILPTETPEVVFPGDRKPATINPEFKKATKDMFEAVHKPKLDPVEDKLAGILKDEAQRVENKPSVENEGSLGKYPPEKRPPKLSEDLLPDIRQMYQGENKTAKEIAEHYKVETKYVNTFIAKHKLRRKTYDKSIPGHGKPDVKKPEETERP